MNISIDLGNTTAKMGLFVGEELQEVWERLSITQLTRLVVEKEPGAVMLSSVSEDPNTIRAALPSHIPLQVLDHHTSIPVEMAYSTPHTLGMDRLAAVIGACAQYPEQHILVIDAGTCITYDFLEAGKRYLGGAIAPGLHLKFKSLHNFTANLPLLDDRSATDLIGDSTENAIKSGVINGTVAEIREIIRMYSDKFGHLQIILCGGDAQFLQTGLDRDVEVQPHLVLKGLNRILLYNA